jgi:hypothetical protein
MFGCMVEGYVRSMVIFVNMVYLLLLKVMS